MDPLWILAIGIVVVVGGILGLRLHAFLALILGALVVAALTPTAALERFAVAKKMPEKEAKQFVEQSLGERIGREFGSTTGRIGILIALASVIGRCLLESGAADRIVRGALRALGEVRTPLAFLVSGYVLGIPVFFDTVFLLMIPLGKAMWMRTGRSYVLYVLSIVCGATMTHSLVPPTPGPLFVASELRVNLGTMILAGCVVGLITSSVGFALAHWLNQRVEIPVRESGSTTLEELRRLAERSDKELPRFWVSILPIALPVILIGGDAVVDTLGSGAAPSPAWLTALKAWSSALGDPNIAMLAASAIALATLVWQKRASIGALGGSIQGALEEAGLIILITAAGGAFGGVLQQTGIGPRIQEISTTYQIAVLPLAFAVTALVRTAQGSATVAMITAVGMFSGMASADQLGFHPVYLALAIGCGSKLIPWMNDSGFWVVCKMSGMTERETLRTFSPTSSLMGVVGLFVVMALAWLAPLR